MSPGFIVAASIASASECSRAFRRSSATLELRCSCDEDDVTLRSGCDVILDVTWAEGAAGLEEGPGGAGAVGAGGGGGA